MGPSEPLTAERDDIARYLMHEFLGVTWQRAYAAADAVLSLRRAEPKPVQPLCPRCRRPMAKDGDASHDGKCRRVLAEKYMQTSGADHDDCAAHAPPLEAMRTLVAWRRSYDGVSQEKLDAAIDELESHVKGAGRPVFGMRTCKSCGKQTRETTAGCDHCDVEDK